MLEIRFLGEQQVMAAGTSIEALRSPRTLGLLAYLVLHAGVPQLRSHVAGLFWPDSTEAQARTNLRRELHQLRTALPDPDRHLGIDAKAVYWLADTPAGLGRPAAIPPTSPPPPRWSPTPPPEGIRPGFREPERRSQKARPGRERFANAPAIRLRRQKTSNALARAERLIPATVNCIRGGQLL